jgi:hypothetical protein
MKITKNVLKQIIKEEIQKVMEESAFYEVPMQEVKELPKEVVAKLKGKELNARFIETDILQIDAKEYGYIISLKLDTEWRGNKTKIIIQDPAQGRGYSTTIVRVGSPVIDYDNQNFGRIERILLGQQ